MEKNIYTIGTGKRRLDDFLAILKNYEIKIAADVRRFPFSRRFPHFCRDVLSKALVDSGIKYIYLGEELGGLVKGGYHVYMKTEDFETGIERLEMIALTSKTVFFCCETLFFRCHRRFIAKRLEEKGWNVYHILDLHIMHREKGAY